ncbi:hypothetical protein [Anaerotignum sp.]|uniref:hypothetical protein n=1 Tax=Anaerotignum sp. TaxID=2039241 RepID=UPI0028981088|nr:hypothetical protein [Anaerotignum sp.]
MQWQRSAICPKDSFAKQSAEPLTAQDGADSEAGFCEARVIDPNRCRCLRVKPSRF